MRTHAEIIADAGGYQKLAALIGLANERARFWAKRESIPSEFWKKIADAGVATLDELAEAASQRTSQDAAA